MRIVDSLLNLFFQICATGFNEPEPEPEHIFEHEPEHEHELYEHEHEPELKISSVQVQFNIYEHVQVLGYHLEWELSSEVVFSDTDKSKEPGKWNPIWKVPSKEVATILDSATRTGISETGARELDDMTLGGKSPPNWQPESYRRKRTYVLELGTRGRKTIVAPNAR
ncbi:hypothetical protein C2G38_2181496 [Gigaspora rosea]|uniref:Uncharacterized protein n=1 Tax=Gigaspora rosea TaxID=44941 RepID=A0A397VK70_9GLOM|nr:hypothetical protein C2G38_2181496 [Gigaspora rosea]